MSERLIIFDCAGVLVDSEIIDSHVTSKAFMELGLNLDQQTVLRRFTGISSKTMIEMIQKEMNISFPDDFIEKVQAQVIDALKNSVQPLMTKLLDYLDKHSVKRVVASSSPRNRVVSCLEASQQMQYFNDRTIFTAQQVSRGKPAPDLFLLAAEKMKYAPENCIVIEDSTAGIEAALAANMQVIGFAGSTHAKYDWYYESLKKYNIPLLKTPEEIIEYIN